MVDSKLFLLFGVGFLALFLVYNTPFFPFTATDQAASISGRVYVTDAQGSVVKVLQKQSILGLATLTVADAPLYDSKKGVDNRLNVELLAVTRVTSGTSKSWSVDTTVITKVDGVQKSSVVFKKSGIESVPSEIPMGVVSRTGSELKTDFGTVPTQTAKHLVSYDVSGTVTVSFVEGPSKTVSFSKQSLAVVEVSYSPDEGGFTVDFTVTPTTTSSTLSQTAPAQTADAYGPCSADPFVGTWYIVIKSYPDYKPVEGVTVWTQTSTEPYKTQALSNVNGEACLKAWDGVSGSVYQVFHYKSGYKIGFQEAPNPGANRVSSFNITLFP